MMRLEFLLGKKLLWDAVDFVKFPLLAEYRTLHAVAGDTAKAKHLLEEKIRELGEGVLVVMGTHGFRRLLWGSKADEVVREFPCHVLVVKAPSPRAPAGVQADEEKHEERYEPTLIPHSQPSSFLHRHPTRNRQKNTELKLCKRATISI